MTRAVAYVRESTARQAEEGYSPDAQRHAIQKFAEEHDFTLVGEYFDVMSGTKEQRPGLQTLMEAAARKEFKAVLVFHSTRWGRDWRVSPYYTKKLSELGVNVHFLDINAEPGSDEAEVMEWANAFVSSQYSKMLSRFTKGGLQEKFERGGHVGGIPVGYDRQTDGLLVPNADSAAVKKAFKLYATGHKSKWDIAQQLADAGVRTRWKGPLGISGVGVMLHNRTYLGYVKRRGEEHQGRHKPLIDEATFKEVQHQLEFRKRGESRPKKYRVYVLGGLLRCAACGAGWRGRTDPDRHNVWVMRYRCYGPKDHGCTGKVVTARADKLELQVKKLVIDRLVIAQQKKEDLLKIIRAEQPNRQREQQRLEAKLRRIKQLFEDDDIERADYVAKRDLLNAELAAVHPAEVPPQIEEALDASARMYETWEHMPPLAKRTGLRFIVESVTVDNGNITAVKLQPWVVPVANAYFVAFGKEQALALLEAGSPDHLTQV